MQTRMDIEGGRFRLAFAEQHVPLEIADQQAGSRDLAERIAVGIDEEQIVMTGDDGREVIADTFLEPALRRELETGRQFAASFEDRG